MKSEQPWKKAKREADKKLRRKKSSYPPLRRHQDAGTGTAEFDPMAIHWGSVTPISPHAGKALKRPRGKT